MMFVSQNGGDCVGDHSRQKDRLIRNICYMMLFGTRTKLMTSVTEETRATANPPESGEMTTQIDWRANQLSQVASVSEDLSVVTLPAGQKPRTSHERSPGGDWRGK